MKNKRENPFKYKAMVYICVLIAGLMGFMLKFWFMLGFLILAAYFKYKESDAKWVKGW